MPALDSPEPALNRSPTSPAIGAQQAAAAAKAAEQDQAARAYIGETYGALAAAAAAAQGSADAACTVPDYQFEGSGADVQTELAAALDCSSSSAALA